MSELIDNHQRVALPELEPCEQAMVGGCRNIHKEGVDSLNRVIWKQARGYPNDPYMDLDAVPEHGGSDPLYQQISWQEELRSPFRVTITDQITVTVSDTNLFLSYPLVGGADARVLNLRHNKREEKQYQSTFLLVPATDGRLRYVVVQSREPRHAPAGLYSLATRLVSQLAYEHCQPLVVVERWWFSLRNGLVDVTVSYLPNRVTPRQTINWHNALADFGHLMRSNTLFSRALAHYREGLLIGESAYKFLAFYKGCEALLELATWFGKQGYRFAWPLLDLPPALAEYYPEFNQQPIRAIIDQKLSEYRDAVAHIEKSRNVPFPRFETGDLWSTTVDYTMLAWIAETVFRTMVATLQSPLKTPNGKPN